MAVFAAVALVGAASLALWARLRDRPTVLLIGDSLLSQTATALRHQLGAHRYHIVNRTFPGSGLLDRDVSWTANARKILADAQPKIVVIEFAGDFFPPRRPGIEPGSEAFFTAWAAEARRLVAEIRSTGAVPYLVLVPPMRDGAADAVVERLNGDYRAIVQEAGAGRVGCIDGHAAFAGPDGHFSADVVLDGKPVTVRKPDGVHLTPAGGDLLARVITVAVVAGRTHPTGTCVGAASTPPA